MYVRRSEVHLESDILITEELTGDCKSLKISGYGSSDEQSYSA